VSTDRAGLSSSETLKKYLDEHQVYYKFIDKKKTIHTKDASAVSGIPLEKITKSLVFIDNGIPFMVVLRGTDKVSIKKLKKNGYQNPKIVPFAEAHKYTGYNPGGTCPMDLKIEMKIIVDKEVMKFEKIYNGGGSKDKLVELKTADIVELNNANTLDIREY